MKQSRYHVLEEVLEAEHIPNMLGRVVVDRMLPLRHYVPNDEAKKQPQDIVENLSGKPIYYDNIAKILDAADNTSVKARLTKLLGAQYTAKDSKNMQIEAAIVTRYNMNNVEDKLEALMNNTTYKKQVLALLEKKEKDILPLVTGMLTCKETRIGFDADRERAYEGQARIPVSAATNTTSAVDPETQISLSSTERTRTAGTVKQEVIFALAYDEVKLEKYLQKRGFLGFWRHMGKDTQSHRGVSLGNEIRTTGGINMFFGSNDDEDEIESTVVESSSLSPRDDNVGFVLL